MSTLALWVLALAASWDAWGRRWLTSSTSAPAGTMREKLQGWVGLWVVVTTDAFGAEPIVGLLRAVRDDHVEIETFDGRPYLLRDDGASLVTATPAADQAGFWREAVRQRGGTLMPAPTVMNGTDAVH